ncbi:tRNA(Ile)-lysidine synthase [Reichenbachiella faecimaris]|uniref:tRNA(Ile)-lysidine synthase n=1 Tax=Reichenbachiella faecimaris TaxID=692418 RepID=A0A1W2GNI5_REIFA|nr:tRNA lysidine(34) synthetase TilS [Reichenbachiella faecimaris]SMD38161.1 tRNA(Ile)-lysidine synthase [Reichenbachiella faecimaris]
MSTLLKSFERFIKKERLFVLEDSLLVAVSGGVDSVVLVHLLKSLGYDLTLAHCNFQLRGEESDLDASFVKSLGKSYDSEVLVEKFDTKGYATEHQVSTQMAARHLRYDWFEKLLTDHKYLLTAHHANDHTETMLYNLTKGTGISGLRGIPLRNDKIRRPLLFTKREEIETYAKTNQLAWREDASNQEDKYSRNHLRLNVIPELKKINPSLEQTMLQNSLRFEALEKLLANEVSTIKHKHLTQSSHSFSLGLDWYDHSKGGLSILVELLKGFGFIFDQCLSIEEAIASQTVGKQFYSEKYVLATDRGKIQIVLRTSDESFSLEIDKEACSATTPYADFMIETRDKPKEWSKEATVACLDADCIQHPLKVRSWEQGDFFYPLGMTGKKKLSDFMIDEKIPVNLKSRVTLFESDGNIIWVAGYRIDDRYKVTPKTKRVLIIKMTHHV